MKFKTLLSAAVLAALTTTGMSAQSVSTCTDNQKNCERKECKFGNKKAFDGITLTEQQQTALQKICADRAAKLKENKAERQQRDSVARQSRRQAKLDYLHQIQQVLTPEQYVTFLENQVVNGGQGKMAKQGHHGNKPGKDMKKGGKDMKKIAKERKQRTMEGKQANRPARNNKNA